MELRRYALIVTALAAAGGILTAMPTARGQPCVPAPCAGVDACKRAADWVLVGTVVEYSEGGFDQACHTTLPFLSEQCSFSTRPPTILLGDAVELRGRSGLIDHGLANITGQAACFSGTLAQDQVASGATPYPGNGIVGQRYRFYGNDRPPGSPLGTGFLIAEPATGPTLLR